MLYSVMILLCFTKYFVKSSELRMCNEENRPNHICKVDENYEKIEIPKEDFHMNCTMSLYDIVEIDEVDHTITIYMNVYLRWYDQRLNHSNGTYL